MDFQLEVVFGHQLEVGDQRAPRLLVFYITNITTNWQKKIVCTNLGSFDFSAAEQQQKVETLRRGELFQKIVLIIVVIVIVIIVEVVLVMILVMMMMIIMIMTMLMGMMIMKTKMAMVTMLMLMGMMMMT